MVARRNFKLAPEHKLGYTVATDLISGDELRKLTHQSWNYVDVYCIPIQARAVATVIHDRVLHKGFCCVVDHIAEAKRVSYYNSASGGLIRRGRSRHGGLERSQPFLHKRPD